MEKKLTKQEVIARINDLLGNGQTKIAKYQRNYSLYNQCPVADLNGKVPYTVGLSDDVYSEDSVVPKLNVVKSAVDAVINKISTARVRPFVNTVKGSFKTIQICKQLQVFFDYRYDEDEVNTKIKNALRDACIFDVGYVYLDEVNGKVSNLQPWNVYTRQSERECFKSVYFEFPNQSVDTLKDEDYKLLNATEKKGLYVKLGYFYDSRHKTKAVLINRQIRDIIELKSEAVPVVPIYYTLPIAGNSTLSIADMLRGIQIEIDQLMKRIADASMLNPAQTFFVPNASNIKVGQLNNKVGNIVQYNSANGASPITQSTPDFIGNQYNALVNDLVERAYNMVGISQLSAQGKKTAGLNSGVALATQSDIESDRFQILVDQYIKMYTDVAKLMCKTFAANDTVIKPNRYNLELTWGDVSEEYDKMRIQFSAADTLSKDPSEKLKQLQTLAQAGIIPATQIASLLEIPDINRGYSVANNAYNTCMTLIDQCIYDGKFEIPDYVPFQMLKEQIINMMLSLRTAQGAEKGNEDDIKKLSKYYEKVEEKEMELQQGVKTEEEMSEETVSEDAGPDGMQNQVMSSDPNMNNAYTNAGTKPLEGDQMANPYSTSAANGGELGG